ncbi:glycoside hydrolase family 9 protein [Chitinophaga nivalis]|uniref:Glycoside hydrolase family 9 protein n=1 Tax=Chitinophaga nivalis TaxID=2991709 RepID=A0ABT3IT96_9BACT|nr:glycoside hydrolase family 9 protein [Chitinophaga nivalis]MCW3463141.1 glycoside hydrolase family 9 protein [Chitinophaga nivalis]MCW3487169.1 glycoside hydrolase family 9 protein [Chitinophaga nivalis]
MKYFPRYVMCWLFLLCPFLMVAQQPPTTWIRINQLGYLPGGSKVAVWATQHDTLPATFQLVNAVTGQVVFTGRSGAAYGRYGPFSQTARLNFSGYTPEGQYYLRAGATASPVFRIGDHVYDGTADFLLRYLRQQRCGYNPFLKDSCHTHDGYTMYGPMPDSTHIDVTGGWHDASDYLQYVTTSANAAWHLLAACRDFPEVFADQFTANGMPGSNQVKDVLDEARWGLDWLLKMHPKADWMFNQIADDRDHQGMRLPKEDDFYGKGWERPVYFCNGLPQGLGKYKNKTTGVASTAGKFASTFALGASLLQATDTGYAALLRTRALSAYAMGVQQPGVCQTASVRSPYIYAEDNWTDDMELAAASLYNMTRQPAYREAAWQYAQQETITPWLGKDTAAHYQWYPFINPGHAALAAQTTGTRREALINYYRTGIERVWAKARQNAFYRGIPFIWCSNNLTTAFATQCYWYRQLSGSTAFMELEQANIDWLLGCNPWGTSMIGGLPASGDSPVDPHSSLATIGHYPLDGGLVDGPVYTAIYKNLIGIRLAEADEYAPFQSELAVYHDDNGDYSTNEPTMDGTASLVYLLAAQAAEGRKKYTTDAGGIIRGDSTRKTLTLVFTGDEFADGGTTIRHILRQQQVPGAFFFTGRFYATPAFQPLIRQLQADGHYLGPHSDQHLLYCDWLRRDSLLVTREQFHADLAANTAKMTALGIPAPAYFLPAYEWYNDSIAAWTAAAGKRLVNFTPGTGSNADYTFPAMGKRYRSSEAIYQAILQYEATHPGGLNGFLLLTHMGTDPRRTDKFYRLLPRLIHILRQKGYQFVPLPVLLP